MKNAKVVSHVVNLTTKEWFYGCVHMKLCLKPIHLTSYITLHCVENGSNSSDVKFTILYGGRESRLERVIWM
jgi:hypothetical protein